MTADHPNARPTQGQLLAHADFVRRLALVLVGSGPDMDDLVQETWLAALASPPREHQPHSIRAWLASVMRNAFAQGVRGRERRTQREAASALSEGQADSTRSIEQLEWNEFLIRRVLELGEAERTTVVLRFLEDRPPREIAERMGVSVNTVNSRLRRALLKLREELDGRSELGREAWCSLLVPTAAEATSESTAGLFTTTIAIMGAKSLIPLFLILAAIAALLFHFSQSDSESTDGLARVARDSESDGDAQRVPPAVVDSQDSERESVGESDGLAAEAKGGQDTSTSTASGVSPDVLAGRIVLLESDGSRLETPNGYVEFRFLRDQPNGRLPVVEGQFQLRVPPGSTPLIEAAFLNEAPATLREIPAWSIGAAPVEWIFVRTGNWTLDVLDQDSKQHLAGVEVLQIDGWEAGRYRPSESLPRHHLIRAAQSPLQLAAQAGHQRYWVKATDHAWKRIDIDHGTHDRAEVELAVEGSLRVWCEPGDMSPLLELRLYEGGFEGFDPAYSGATWRNGEWTVIDGLAPGAYQLRAEVGTFPKRPILFAQRELELHAGESLEVRLELDESLRQEPAAPLAGRLRLPESVLDLPLELRVMRAVGPALLEDDEQSLSMSQWKATGVAGEFAFDFGLVTPGRVKFGLYPLRRSWVIDLPNAGNRNLILEGGDFARVEVSVVNSETRAKLPVEGIAWSPWEAGLWQVTEAPRGSDAESYLQGMNIEHVDDESLVASFMAPVGPLRFGFWHEGFGEDGRALRVERDRVNRFELELRPRPMLELVFLDPEGRPVNGRGFRLEAVDHQGEAEMLRRDAGRYVYDFEDEGEWRVVGAPAGWKQSGAALVRVEAGKKSRLSIPVQPADPPK